VTIDEVGGTVTNPFLNTLGLAYDVGLRSAQAFAGPTFTISCATSISKTYTNIIGSRFRSPLGSMFRLNAVTVAQNGASMTGMSDTTMADFNTAWAGKTFGQFDATWGIYTFAQFDLLWAGKTFGQFDTAWTGKTFDQFSTLSGYQNFGSFATTPLLTTLS
jgi:hypothetical protein